MQEELDINLIHIVDGITVGDKEYDQPSIEEHKSA